jgi:transketolase
MPGLILIRPADAGETVTAWKFALEYRKGPVALALTRQKLPVLDRGRYAPAENLKRGAYVLTGADQPHVLLLATGSEVALALQAHERLAAEGVPSRVVNMPSWELFECQPKEYRDAVLPPNVRARVAVEAGMQLGWERYIGMDGVFIGMSTFGASAPVEAVFQGFGITADAIVQAAKRILV